MPRSDVPTLVVGYDGSQVSRYAVAIAAESAGQHGKLYIIHAYEEGPDLSGARGLGRVRALLGSVSHEVLHLADRPVLVIPSNALPTLRRWSTGGGERPVADTRG